MATRFRISSGEKSYTSEFFEQNEIFCVAQNNLYDFGKNNTLVPTSGGYTLQATQQAEQQFSLDFNTYQAPPRSLLNEIFYFFKNNNKFLFEDLDTGYNFKFVVSSVTNPFYGTDKITKFTVSGSKIINDLDSSSFVTKYMTFFGESKEFIFTHYFPGHPEEPEPPRGQERFGELKFQNKLSINNNLDFPIGFEFTILIKETVASLSNCIIILSNETYDEKLVLNDVTNSITLYGGSSVKINSEPQIPIIAIDETDAIKRVDLSQSSLLYLYPGNNDISFDLIVSNLSSIDTIQNVWVLFKQLK